MYLITVNNNLVGTCNIFDFVKSLDGNYAPCSEAEAEFRFVQDDNTVYPLDFIFHEIDSIPSDITFDGKWLYSEDDGFYPNPDYKAQPRSVEEIDTFLDMLEQRQADVEIEADYRLCLIELGLI